MAEQLSQSEYALLNKFQLYKNMYFNCYKHSISNRSIPFTENQIILLDAFDDEYGGVIV